MTVRAPAALCSGLVVLCLSVAPAAAQVRASEQASLGQTIAGTHFTIEYSRPVARGRDSLFGKVVKWGEPWTPGANWATTLEVDDSVRLNGHTLPAGKYSVWMIPRRDSAWTVVLNRSGRRFHTQRPSPDEDALRFAAVPAEGPHMETLSWYFPVIGPGGGILRMHWGSTYVPIDVRVPSPPIATLTAEERAPYLGVYRLSFVAPPEGAPDAPPPGAGPPPDAKLEVVEVSDMLRARMDPDPGDGMGEMALVPNGEHRFNTGFFMDGELVEIETEMSVVFTLGADGSARGFEVRGLEGEVMARGERIP